MIDQKKKEERLTEIQVNIEVVREMRNVRQFCGVSSADDLLEKAIKNLNKLIAPVV